MSLEHAVLRNSHAISSFLGSIAAASGAEQVVRGSLVHIAEHLDAPVVALVTNDGNLLRAYGIAADDVEAIERLTAHDTMEVLGEGTCAISRARVGAGNGEMIAVARPVPLTQLDITNLTMMSRMMGLVADFHRNVEVERELRHDQETQRRMLEALLDVQERISHRDPLDDILMAIAQQAAALVGADFGGIELIESSVGSTVAVVADESITFRGSSELRPLIAAAAAQGGPVEQRTATASGETRVVAVPVRESGTATGALFVGWEASKNSDSEPNDLLAALAEQASVALTDARTAQALERSSVDPLTGLATRDHFFRQAAEIIASDREVALLFMDLDGFKQINDTYGHGVGDALLSTVGNRISREIRSGDIAGRLGGDEFAVVLRYVGDIEKAHALADRLIGPITAPIEVGGVVLRPRVSIGVATGSDIEVDLLLHQADLAMYAAKADATRSVATFDGSEVRAGLRGRDLAFALSQAVAHGELFCEYQPVIDASDGEVTMVEALVRWNREGYGVVPPDDFIPVAEKAGLIDVIGRFVLDRALDDLVAWRAAGARPDLKVSVNVAPDELFAVGFVRRIAGALKRRNLPPEVLCIEVTETASLPAGAVEQLQELVDLGVDLAIDDLGTGHSSLGRLIEMPANVIKIDRSFVMAMPSSDRALAIVRSVIAMSNELGLQVIAEGVENEVEAQMLRDLGCTHLQGFHLARPMPQHSIADLVAKAPAIEAMASLS